MLSYTCFTSNMPKNSEHHILGSSLYLWSTEVGASYDLRYIWEVKLDSRFRGFHLPAEHLFWNIERSTFPAVVCYPLESFFTNRLYHLLGNLSRCHLANSTPVFSHVAMCTNRVDRHLSPFSLCLMRWRERSLGVFLFSILLDSVSLLFPLCKTQRRFWA